jgi:hypothetical protein
MNKSMALTTSAWASSEGASRNAVYASRATRGSGRHDRRFLWQTIQDFCRLESGLSAQSVRLRTQCRQKSCTSRSRGSVGPAGPTTSSPSGISVPETERGMFRRRRRPAISCKDQSQQHGHDPWEHGDQHISKDQRTTTMFVEGATGSSAPDTPCSPPPSTGGSAKRSRKETMDRCSSSSMTMGEVDSTPESLREGGVEGGSATGAEVTGAGPAGVEGGTATGAEATGTDPARGAKRLGEISRGAAIARRDECGRPRIERRKRGESPFIYTDSGRWGSGI